MIMSGISRDSCFRETIMKDAIRTSVLLSALATIAACSENGNVIDEDGVYTGDLSLASPRWEDGSSYTAYTIDLEAGEELDLTMQSSDFDAYLHLEDDNGNIVGEDDDSAGGSNANLVLIAPTTATYRVIANTFSEGEYGEYVLAVRRTTPDNVDGIYSGVLNPVDGKSLSTNSYPTHTIEAQSGELLDIQLTSGTFDTYMEVKDSNGNVVGEDDDGASGTNSRLTLPIHSAGTYTVIVRSFDDNESGPYTLTVRRDAIGEAAEGERVEQFSGQLMDWNDRLDDGTPYALHVIEAQAGERLEVHMMSSAFDSYLQLWDEFETVFAEDDDSGGGLNSMLNFVAPADGQYVIVANSVGEDATGAYNITLRRKTLDAQLAAGNVEILSGTLSDKLGVLADGTPMSSHEIEAEAGERLDISMMAGGFDAYLVVFDAQDNKLSEDDDSGGGTNAQLSVIAPSDGTYRIVANSYSDGAGGPYTITVERE